MSPATTTDTTLTSQITNSTITETPLSPTVKKSNRKQLSPKKRKTKVRHILFHFSLIIMLPYIKSIFYYNIIAFYYKAGITNISSGKENNEIIICNHDSETAYESIYMSTYFEKQYYDKHPNAPSFCVTCNNGKLFGIDYKNQ